MCLCCSITCFSNCNRKMLISSIVSILLVFSVHVTGHATVSSNALSGLTLLKRDRIANASSSSTLLQDWYQQRARQQEHVAISLESSSSLFLSGNQEHQQNRRLQADNYRADYVGQFQAFRGPSCTGPSPVIRAYCIGTINVERTSSPSIACTSFVDTEFGLVGVECLTTCTGSACDGIYLNSGMPIQSAPFGEVFFSCSGPNQIDVESSFSWEDTGGDGSCLADPNDPYGFNLHVTRLGVSCESSFVFDDFYADCASSLPLDGNPGDEYACVTGSICDGLACTVDYDGIVMFSQGHNFASECVTSLNGFLISPAPTPGVNEVGTLFTSKFNASWALNVEVDFAPSTSCTTSTAGSRTILIVCGTPGGSIKIIESDSSVQCETITSNSMECSDSSSVVNVFSSVIYVSEIDFVLFLIEKERKTSILLLTTTDLTAVANCSCLCLSNIDYLLRNPRNALPTSSLPHLSNSLELKFHATTIWPRPL